MGLSDLSWYAITITEVRSVEEKKARGPIDAHVNLTQPVKVLYCFSRLDAIPQVTHSSQ